MKKRPAATDRGALSKGPGKHHEGVGVFAMKKRPAAMDRGALSKGPDKPRDWSTRCEQLRAWLHAHSGTWPKQGTDDAEELRSARWANNQRTFYSRGELAVDRAFS